MYLSPEEVAAYLGLSVSWVRQRLDEGTTPLAKHLKCGNGRKRHRKRDNSSVRISSRSLAEYVHGSVRDGWDHAPEAGSTVSEIEITIWTWVRWYRNAPVTQTEHGGSCNESPQLQTIDN